MKFFIDEMRVVFPYDYIYPEQLAYMTELKRGLDDKGHIVLEMPSGTGKTISLLSCLVAYLNHHPLEKIKLVYCTRTVVEMTKTMEELRRLIRRWKDEGEELRPLVALSLSARKNLCLHEEVSSLTYTQEVDAACRTLMGGWADQQTARCSYYEPFSGAGGGAGNGPQLPPGVYSLDDLRDFGKETGACPYFVARGALETCDIIVQSYLYLVDPKVSPAVKQVLSSNTIVVMDEGHNVDDVCIESMSMVVTKSDAQRARDQNMRDLRRLADEAKTEQRQRLQDEYRRLVSGLELAQAAASSRRGDRGNGTMSGSAAAAMVVAESDSRDAAAAAAAAAPPAAAAAAAAGTSATQIAAAIGARDVTGGNSGVNELPGALRHAGQFLGFLGRIADFFHRAIARMSRAQVADPLTFLARVKEECGLDVRHLRFTAERLTVLLNTLGVRDAYAFRHISLIADFVATLAVFYKDDRHALPGYVVVFEPFDPMEPGIPDPVLRLTCVDASLAVRDIFASYRSVVLTSGTLSPLDIYPKLLGFVPVRAKSFPMTLSRRCICPVIVTRSSDQSALAEGAGTAAASGSGANPAAAASGATHEDLTSSYVVRTDATAAAHVAASYGRLMLDIAKTVPDGVCCFFTGYRYMGEILLMWQNTGVLAELSRHKLVFVETQGVAETSNALASYRRACDIGRGAIFISIARGKIAEGIDFDRHYGRAVVCFGVPFLPPDDRGLQERIRWMESCLGIGDAEFRTFDAMRQAAQCIGRVLRNKSDYGMMILVDRRFAMNDKRRKLPQWIQQHIKENANLSTDAAIAVAHRFFLEMAQPWDRARDLGSTLFDATALAAKGHGTPTPYVPQRVRDDAAALEAAEDGAAASGGDDDVAGAGGAGIRPVQETTGLGMRRPKRSR